MISIKNLEKIKEKIEQVKFDTQDHKNVVLFTNGNYWYIPTLINNLLTSMKIFEPERKMLVFCSDLKGYNEAGRLNFDYYEFIDIPELNISNEYEGSDGTTDAYTRLSFIKIVIIGAILELGYIPLYIDPDMAFTSPCIDDILSYLDKIPSKNTFVCAGDTNWLNSNIMTVMPTESNRIIFSINTIIVESIVNNTKTYGDEDYLRLHFNKNNTVCLDKKYYPQGCDPTHKAKILHANCNIGLNNKINYLKINGGWFLEENVLLFDDDEFMAQTKDIYPPFLDGDLIENYFYKKMKYMMVKTPFDRKCLNISWTNLYCNSRFKNTPFNSDNLQNKINKLDVNGKYFAIVQFDEGVLEKLPPDTLVFGCCEGHVPIPLIYESTMFDNIILKKWEEKDIFCSFTGQYSHKIRMILSEYTRQFEDYTYKRIHGNYNMTSYIYEILSSKFCLAPRGFGRGSFRFYEILKLGSVPVYVWDDKEWLPFKNVINYSRLCISINIQHINQLDNILRGITKEEYCDMITYYQTVKHYFTCEGVSDEIMNTKNISFFNTPSSSLTDNLGQRIDYKLNDVFKNKTHGFFIELGANDGITQSNTNFFEKYRGWRGVLIEPSISGYKSCLENRKNSHCFNYACVSDTYDKDIVYGDFDGGLMSSVEGKRLSSSNLVPVKCGTLSEILDKVDKFFLPHIDLLSIDTGGYELEILNGLDFSRHKPSFIIIEICTKDFNNILCFLEKNGYKLHSNFSNYNKQDCPNWDETHNDYLFYDSTNYNLNI